MHLGNYIEGDPVEDYVYRTYGAWKRVTLKMGNRDTKRDVGGFKFKALVPKRLGSGG